MTKEKAEDVVKSVTAELLAKTLSDVQTESGRDEPEQAPPSEDERIAKLDLIQDMQLILIDRYRSASRLLVAGVIVMILVLAAQVLQFSRSLSLHGKVIAIAEQQSAMVQEQRELAKKADQSKKDVEEVRVSVARTEEKVKEAVESSPKLEIDPDSGKTKVVVPVKRPKKDDDGKLDKKDRGKKGDKGGSKRPKAQAPPPAPPEPIEVELQ